MKINEKNLCMFATTPPVDLEGWLNKRGEMNKSWQRRWFVLKGNLLFYFEKRGDKEPLGMIILEGCTVELAEEGEQYCFQVIFHGPNNRTYYLSTESQSNMEQWMKALTCAGYDYMKLMVAELQRQLDEIEGQCREKTPDTTPLPPPKAPPRRQNPFNTPTLTTEYASNAAFGSISSDKSSTWINGTATQQPPTFNPTGDESGVVEDPSPSTVVLDFVEPKAAVTAAHFSYKELMTPTSVSMPVSSIDGHLTSVRDNGKWSTSEEERRSGCLVQTDEKSDFKIGREKSITIEASEDHSDGGQKDILLGDVSTAATHYSFETMHSTLGIPILADLSKWNKNLQVQHQQSKEHQ
ncbi:sesquipedalian-2 isoform X1 [Anopheles cruzii]|uniref:sesquipedalian-2 isoform X1 n=1 Tax=Anopheles cruzii TaxID=68878 RepID=UPI0022EC44F2|nr:sesquipedalian-2 isoform X1 [Anopheles cruzii]XP_052867319.1 sesquipedalian-2 isoform X1 [Anopheles cruzii]